MSGEQIVGNVRPTADFAPRGSLHGRPPSSSFFCRRGAHDWVSQTHRDGSLICNTCRANSDIPNDGGRACQRLLSLIVLRRRPIRSSNGVISTHSLANGPKKSDFVRGSYTKTSQHFAILRHAWQFFRNASKALRIRPNLCQPVTMPRVDQAMGLPQAGHL